jgi:hypothetical protein
VSANCPDPFDTKTMGYEETSAAATVAVFLVCIGQSFRAGHVSALVVPIKSEGPGHTVRDLGSRNGVKEVIAGQIHRLSGRDRRLVAVNCAAIPGGLIESQLFGDRKGAVSGVVENYAGLIESAAGGTLLLDEIGDLAVEAQADGEQQGIRTPHPRRRARAADRHAGARRRETRPEVGDLTGCRSQNPGPDQGRAQGFQPNLGSILGTTFALNDGGSLHCAQPACRARITARS